MNPCPLPTTLDHLLAETLEEGERAAVEAHVEVCSRCQEALQRRLEEQAIPQCPGRDAAPTETVDELGPSPALLEQLRQLSLATPLLPGERKAEPDALTGALPTLPGYEVLGVLGRGGMGVVYQARQLALKRLVALKVMLAGAHASADERVRLQREAEAVARLQHPNIVQVYEVGEHQGLPYLALEYVAGGTLAQALDGRPLPPRQGAALVHTLAAAVHFAHCQGVLHRDLKPANVLLAACTSAGEGAGLQAAPWVPKVADFGLARQLDGTAHTASGAVLGTPSYMAPEQASGQSGTAGPAVDVYGLGSVLYQVLTGRPPFVAASNLETLQQVVSREVVPPRRLQPSVPRDLETICLKCLQKEPARRYASAQALADDLDRFLRGEPIRARPARVWERGWKWVRRRPAAATLLAVSLLALLSLLIGGWWYNVELRLARDLADQQRQEAVTNLYHSLVGEIKALRLARESGYRARVWDRLKKARWLETPDRNLEELRREAVACMGDFVGLEPTVRPNPGTTRVSGQCMALRPDGAQLALGLADGTVLLQDPATGTERVRLTGHRAEISAVAWGADGKLLVTADVAGRIQLWEPGPAGAWDCTHPLKVDRPPDQTPFGSIVAVALRPDGQEVAACPTGATTVQVWNRADGTRAAPFHSPQGEPLRVLAWSPDGRLLAGGYNTPRDKGLLVWDGATRRCRDPLSLKLGMIFAVVFSPDGNLLAVGGNRGWAVFETSKFRQHLFRGGDQVKSLAFSPDSRFLFIASEAIPVVRIWDLATNREEAVLQHPGGPFAVALSPDGGTLYAASPQSLRSWKLRGTEEKLVLTGHNAGVPHLAFSPGGKLLASVGKNGTIKVWDPVTGELRKRLTRSGTGVEAVAFSPDGRLLATADMDGFLRFWEVPSWKELPAPKPDLGPDLWTVAFSRDGSHFGAGGGGGLQLWRMAEPRGAGTALGALLPRPAGLPDGVITTLCFSPDSERLACVSRGRADGDYRVYLCERPFRQARELPARLHFFVRALAFTPDSRHLTFVSDRRRVEVWDVVSGQEVISFGSAELVSGYGGIALSADGAWFACGNQAVTIWDMASRKLLLTLPEERSTVWALTWSPNRELLAVSSSDSGPVIWNIRKLRAQLGELGLDW